MPKRGPETFSNETPEMKAHIERLMEKDPTLKPEDAKEIIEISKRSIDNEKKRLKGPHRTEALEENDESLR